MRTLLIANKRSGGGDTGLYDYLRALSDSGPEVTLRYIDDTKPIDELVRDANTFDNVVAAGGDGTVSAVCYALRGTNVPILVHPSGTANLLAMNLGIHPEPRVLAETTVSGKPVSFDLGEIETPSTDGTGSSRAGFTIMAGAGYDASLVKAAEPMKSSLGPAAYLLGALGNPTPTLAKFTIDLDGERIETDGIAVLLVNFGRLQFDLEVARGADPRDGLLDIAVLRSKNIAELVPTVVAGLFDRTGDRNAIPGIDVYSARAVSVASDPPLRMQYDGELVKEFTPFTARVFPEATTLLLPVDSPYAR